ncbi:MAG: YciI-like protein [Tepidiformaceae bacterium]
MKYLLLYDYIEDVVERRAPLREGHLGMAKRYLEEGTLLMAGALNDPIDGAVLVFKDREAAEAFAAEDPYVLNGLVTSHRVREWNVVVGE